MTTRRKARLLAMALVLAGCGGDFGNIDNGDGSGGDDGNLRLVNASQTGFLDLYESGTALTTSVSLGRAGSYVSLNRGSRTLGIRESGNVTTLATATVAVASNDHQALVAYRSAGSLQTTVLSEDEAAPATNNAKLRVFNTAQADAGNIDVYVVAATTTCAALAAATTVATFGSVGNAASSYAELAAATAPYRVCVTGVGVRNNLRLDIGSLVLTNQRIVTLVLSRLPNNALQALTIDQQAGVAPIDSAAP